VPKRSGQVTAVEDATSALEMLLEVQTTDSQWVLFRGEARHYTTLSPTLSRLPEKERTDAWVKMKELAYLLYDRFISLYTVDEGYGCGPTYQGRSISKLDLLGTFGVPGFAEIHHDLEILLQHYGYATNWLDLTFSPQVALWFAAGEIGGVDGIGYVHYWPSSIVGERFAMNPCALFRDTARLNEFFSDCHALAATRPHSQAAAAVRLGVLESRQESAALVQCRRTITFRKRRIPESVQNLSLFPADPLLQMIKAAEGHSTRKP
jgi:hypothetical protein